MVRLKLKSGFLPWLKYQVQRNHDESGECCKGEHSEKGTRSLIGSSVWEYLYLYLLTQGHLSRLFNETNYATIKS